MEQQVCSRPLAERMKELGFVQDSVYKYCGGHIDYSEAIEGNFEKCENTDLLDDDEYCHTAGLTCEFTLSAFTVAELGEILHESIKNEKGWERLHLSISKRDGKWIVAYPALGGFYILHQEEIKLADSMAKMLIYLAEQNIINPKDIKI